MNPALVLLLLHGGFLVLLMGYRLLAHCEWQEILWLGALLALPVRWWRDPEAEVHERGFGILLSGTALWMLEMNRDTVTKVALGFALSFVAMWWEGRKILARKAAAEDKGCLPPPLPPVSRGITRRS